MKKLIICFITGLIATTTLQAQNFEGQITFKMEVKGENAALFAAMMPNSMDLFFLNGESMIRNNGGMMAGRIGDIVTKKDGSTYMVLHKKKTVYKMGKEDTKTSAEFKPVITREGEETVKGYKCTKYLVKFPSKEDAKGELYQYLWATKDIDVAKPQTVGSSSNMFLKEIEGFPVKVDQYITMSQMGGMTINTEMTLEKIEQKKPDASLFEIPKKYKMEDFDESKLGKM
ncbi:MAG: DUF4412 domain-containing protein [Flavobacteriales bacterium]|nr:DUF4412 domain-containing protein [Flavobacteriales bacterium]